MRLYRLFKYYFKEDLDKDPIDKCTPAFAVVAPNRTIAGIIFYRCLMEPFGFKANRFREFTVALRQHPLKYFTPFLGRTDNKEQAQVLTSAFKNDGFNIEFIKFHENKSLLKTSSHSFIDAFHQFKHLFPEQKIPLEICVVFDDVFAVLLGSGRKASSITFIENNVTKVPRLKPFLIRHQVKQP